MSLSPRQKLKVLDGVVEIYRIFQSLGSDTGLFPYGDDTGRAQSTSQIATTSYRACLNANTVHNSEGWWIACNTMLTAMGA